MPTQIATRSDLPALAALERACFPGGAWSEGSLDTELSRGFILIDGLGRGYAIGLIVIDECELLRIGVHPEARKQGLGRTVLSAFHDTCGLRTVVRCHLEVRENNRAALALYTGSGYAISGRRRGYYPGGIDALTMARDLF